MPEDFYKQKRHKEWREKVLKRDKYLCQECLRYGRRTEATSILSCAMWSPMDVHCVLHATTRCIRKRVEAINGDSPPGHLVAHFGGKRPEGEPLPSPERNPKIFSRR